MNNGRVFMEVSLDKIAHNMKILRNSIDKKIQMMIVVKADAYGCGAVRIAKTAARNGADWFGVAICEEGRELREQGVDTPILILGYTPEANMAEAVCSDLTQTIYSYDIAAKLAKVAAKLGKTANVHIKIDTGMARLGFDTSEESIKEIEKISRLENIRISGVYSHFANADAADKTFAREQYAKFAYLCERLGARGIDTGLVHMANSAAVLDLKEFYCEMVRIGLIAYGLPPSSDVKFDAALRPIMGLKTYVSYVKDVAAGESIGYGRTYFTTRRTRVATIPVGYADGYSRILSNRGRVLIHGAYAPIVGNICMDQFMVDVTDISGVKIDDEVVLIGEQDGQEISVDEIAALENTINYEVICGIGKRVPRIYR